MFVLNYPELITTTKELISFTEYVVEGLIREYSYPIGFKGVKIEEDFSPKSVKVIIPIEIPENKVVDVETYLKGHLEEVFKELLHRCCCAVNFYLHFEVSCLPTAKFEVHILSEEENDMEICLDVKKIIHQKSARGEFFTVVWGDDTQTTVKLAEGDSSDEYTAFLYALGKKLFKENKGKAREYIRAKKKVFEEEMEIKRREKRRFRKNLAIQQSLSHIDDEDIEDNVYANMFVAPALISRTVFKRNK